MNKVTVPFGQLMSLVDEYVEVFEDRNVPPSVAVNFPVTLTVEPEGSGTKFTAKVVIPMPYARGDSCVQ